MIHLKATIRPDGDSDNTYPPDLVWEKNEDYVTIVLDNGQRKISITNQDFDSPIKIFSALPNNED